MQVFIYLGIMYVKKNHLLITGNKKRMKFSVSILAPSLLCFGRGLVALPLRTGKPVTRERDKLSLVMPSSTLELSQGYRYSFHCSGDMLKLSRSLTQVI